ncbi:hypothetical protein GPALN_002239 [Globodera pallida]|nr:hypothetical protein GPALN_002239 [Globodera pallida]
MVTDSYEEEKKLGIWEKKGVGQGKGEKKGGKQPAWGGTGHGRERPQCSGRFLPPGMVTHASARQSVASDRLIRTPITHHQQQQTASMLGDERRIGGIRHVLTTQGWQRIE